MTTIEPTTYTATSAQQGPTREEMERLYAQLLSTIVQLAQALGKPCPVVTREERRRAREFVVK